MNGQPKLEVIQSEKGGRGSLNCFGNLEIAVKDLNSKSRIEQIDIEMNCIAELLTEKELEKSNRLLFSKRYDALALEKGALLKKKSKKTK
jgi:hypothetical protein